MRATSEAIGRTRVERTLLDPASLHRFALACDHPGEPAAAPLAHWAYFLESESLDRLGADGHPRLGSFLPEIPLPRRMFGGAEIWFSRSLEIGETAELVTRIADIREKAGSSGPLVLVTLDRSLRQRGEEAVRERRTLVYRGVGPAITLPPARATTGDWTPGPVELFRFSAATFNAHRIHYDRDYAADEGYPERVVHGPLTAARLAASLVGGKRLARFTFRASSPLFCGQAVSISSDGATATAVRCDGTPAMIAQAVLA